MANYLYDAFHENMSRDGICGLENYDGQKNEKYDFGMHTSNCCVLM